MARRRQLDSVGVAGIARRIVLPLLILALGCVSSPAASQDAPSGAASAIEKAFAEQRWQQVVDQAETFTKRSADLEYYVGVSLAQLGRFGEARVALLRGRHMEPRDERFALELGGVAFKQKRYGEAVEWLHRALRLNPSDAYAADFLATVYFLQGNLEAALKYWNRIDKPRVANMQVEPGLRIDAALLDRAFAFAPGGTLLLPDLLATRERVRRLGIFPTFSINLNALPSGDFDLGFAAAERDGWGHGKLEALLSTFRGIGYQTIYPEYFNISRSAINVTSLVRWDEQKRRVDLALSGPLNGNPKYRYEARLDARDENWDLQSSFKGPSTSLGALDLHRLAASAEIASFESAGWNWSMGGEFSYRRYGDVSNSQAFPPQILLTGYQLKHAAQLNRELLRLPERRFESSIRISSDAGRIWSASPHAFEKLQGLLTARWLPRMTGDDYAVEQQIRAGTIFGSAPFDELYMLGLERDNDLWLRAHIGTRDGRKGSAPFGTNYFLSNSELDKNVYSNGLLTVKLSPFLDTGKSADSLTGPRSRQWLCDTGVQAKLRILGVGLVFVYGKDLRSGNNAFYVTTHR